MPTTEHLAMGLEFFKYSPPPLAPRADQPSRYSNGGRFEGLMAFGTIARLQVYQAIR
jgi:hypothetical protein